MRIKVKEVAENIGNEDSLKKQKNLIEINLQLKFYESILSHISDYVYVWNNKKQWVYANKALQELWGFTSPDQYLGKTNAEINDPPEVCEYLSRQLDYVIRTKQPITGELPYTSRLGIYGLHEYVFSPLLDADGNVEYIVGITRLITKHKEIEDALQRSEERYRKYYELDLVGMAVLSPTAKWIEANQALCEIFGYTRTELMAKNWEDLTDPSDRIGDVEQFQQLQQGIIDHYSREKRCVRKDGRVIYCLIFLSSSKEPNGKVTEVYMIVIDITIEKQYEIALTQAKEDLKSTIREVLSNKQDIKQAVDSINETDRHGIIPPKENATTALTSKQLQILNLIAAGNTSKEIANKLFLSKHTVDFHRRIIRKKFGLQTQQELLRYCIKLGLS